MDANGLATKDQLLNAGGKRRFRYVELPMARLRVRIRSLTEGELARYQQQLLNTRGRGFRADKLEDATRRLFVLCVVDEQGNRLFADHDADKLAEWDAADSGVLYDACVEHCGINREDIEAVAKNSGEIPVADSL